MQSEDRLKSKIEEISQVCQKYSQESLREYIPTAMLLSFNDTLFKHYYKNDHYCSFGNSDQTEKMQERARSLGLD